jgi:hypothetical protein
MSSAQGVRGDRSMSVTVISIARMSAAVINDDRGMGRWEPHARA